VIDLNWPIGVLSKKNAKLCGILSRVNLPHFLTGIVSVDFLSTFAKPVKLHQLSSFLSSVRTSSSGPHIF
jgi:hypothetical protein